MTKLSCRVVGRVEPVTARQGAIRMQARGPLRPLHPPRRVDALPVEERYGIVFAFLDDLPETEHGRDEWRLDRAASATASSPQAVGGG